MEDTLKTYSNIIYFCDLPVTNLKKYLNQTLIYEYSQSISNIHKSCFFVVFGFILHVFNSASNEKKWVFHLGKCDMIKNFCQVI